MNSTMKSHDKRSAFSPRLIVRANFPYAVVFGESGVVRVFDCSRREWREINVTPEKSRCLESAARSRNFLISQEGQAVVSKAQTPTQCPLWKEFIISSDSVWAFRHNQIVPDHIFDAHVERHLADISLVQAQNTPSSAYCRISSLGEIAETKKVAFLGDDDLLGISAKNMPWTSVVFDIDPTIIGQTRRAGIAGFVGDFRDPFPPIFESAFDTTFCDPPSEESWIDLFLSRASALTKIDGEVVVATNTSTLKLLIQSAKKCGLRFNGFLHEEPNRYYNILGALIRYQSIDVRFMKTRVHRVPLANPMRFDLRKSEKIGLVNSSQEKYLAAIGLGGGDDAGEAHGLSI